MSRPQPRSLSQAGHGPAAHHERAPTPQPPASSPPPHLLSQSGGGPQPHNLSQTGLGPHSHEWARAPQPYQPTRCRAAGGAQRRSRAAPSTQSGREGTAPSGPAPDGGRFYINMRRNDRWVTPTAHPDLEAEREVSIYRVEADSVFCVRGKLTAEATHGVPVTHAPPRGRSERRAARGSSRAPPARGG